jgi:hypothetical protein
MKVFGDLNPGDYIYIKTNNIIEAKQIKEKENSICNSVIFTLTNGEMLWFELEKSHELDGDTIYLANRFN